MRVEKAVLAMLAAAGVWSWDTGCDAAATGSVRLCGRNLSEIMSRVCHVYNSPAWDDPTVVEQPVMTRRRRQVGIADECCTIGCTWEQLTEYCAVITNPDSSLDELAEHLIADKSAEAEAKAAVSAEKTVGEQVRVRNVDRAAPVVGTVSPLLTWGRTLHADLPPAEQDHYAYVAVYASP